MSFSVAALYSLQKPPSDSSSQILIRTLQFIMQKMTLKKFLLVHHALQSFKNTPPPRMTISCNAEMPIRIIKCVDYCLHFHNKVQVDPQCLQLSSWLTDTNRASHFWQL